MSFSPSSSVHPSVKADWPALVSCCLATFLLFGLVSIYSWLAVDQDQIFRFSDTVKSTIGIDFLWLCGVILLAGTPTALLLGCVGLSRTRKSRGRRGRWLALIGCLLSVLIIGLVTWFLIDLGIAFSHWNLTM